MPTPMPTIRPQVMKIIQALVASAESRQPAPITAPPRARVRRSPQRSDMAPISREKTP